jgi:hypothetical protein
MSALTVETNMEKKSVGTQYCFGEPCSNTFNLGSCENKHFDLPLCGPLSWKIENDIKNDSISDSDSDSDTIDLPKPIKLVRCCKTNCWAYGHKVLKACGRTKLKDILVDTHESIVDEKIVGCWYYLVMSIYQNYILQYAHVSVYLDGEKMKGDIADYVLRNKDCIKKIDFQTQENIDYLISYHYVN